MTSAEETLDAGQIRTWLNATTRQLEQSLTGAARAEVIAELRRDAGAPRAIFRILAGLALLDDCLRVAHAAIEADGVVEDDELARAYPLARVAARSYFAALPRYDAFGEPELTTDELRAFLAQHRADAQPFGNASPTPWRGLRLCQEVAARTGNDALVRDHERMLVRIADAVIAGRRSPAEQAARRQLRELLDGGRAGGVDPRIVAFCRPDGPEVFSSVAHGSQLYERDPLDVETIHADARAAFSRQVEHAITPARHGAGHGRTLLVLGAAGSGKTHLLRAFRADVHERRVGYVGYLQMSSDVGDYARYVLAKLVDSLERPYDAPELEESALLYLSDGLAEHDHVIPPEELDRLRAGDLEPAALPGFVGRLVDRLVRTERLSGVDSDLVQALLLLQRRDPAIQRRVVKFLRCEPLTPYEQELLGGLAPRTQAEDPARMLEALGRLAFDLQQASLVLLVDQVEDAVPEDAGFERVQRAIDVLRRLADAVPSCVVVIACLEDVYDVIRPRLTQSVVDRLERDPPPVRLSARRSRDEIEAMLVRRLQHLYDALDAPWRADEPLFPCRAEDVDALANQRARDCLSFFRSFHERCIAAGTIVESGSTEGLRAPVSAGGQDALARAWNDALVQPIDPPDDDRELLEVVARGVRACGDELGIAVSAELDASGARPRLTVSLPGRPLAPRVIEVCNRQAQGGRLGAQIDALRAGVPAGHVPVALRTSEFAFGPRTQIAKQIGALIEAGGVKLVIDDAQLRTMIAFEAFAAAHAGHAGFAAWRAETKPIAGLSALRTLLELGNLARVEAAAPSQAVAAPPAVEPAPARPRVAPPPVAPPPVAPVEPSRVLRLGVAPTVRADVVSLDLDALPNPHMAFLGGTGSGKTTLALVVIEQLLERGISALLVDRKGDLARYASPAWWDEVPADPAQAARKRALRERVDVALYTPGEPAGRPLRLPVIPPAMSELSSHEKDHVANVAAAGLASMIGYGGSDRARKCKAILKKAIELHAEVGGTTVRDLIATIERPDPELLAAVGNLVRLFGAVVEDLQMLELSRGGLLAGEGEPLDVEAMLAPRDGRPRLAIVSAAALAEPSVLQFWMSRLLVELGRMVRRTPSKQLRAVAFFDEADLYIPVVGQPATKDPMFDLLRRARSGGLGVFLATQNPGDLDYRARDNIATWFLGKIAQDRAIEKMRNLLGAYPNVGPRLASQPTGSFFLLGGTQARELRADMPLMKTDQLSEAEIAELARPDPTR